MGAAKSQPKAKDTERRKDLLGLSKCPQHHVQPTPHRRGGRGALLCVHGRSELPAASPHPPGIALLWGKVLLGDPCPFWTGLKPQQEHKRSLSHFPLSFKETEMMPILKVCLPRDSRPSDERMLNPRTAEHYFYRFRASYPMRNF